MPHISVDNHSPLQLHQTLQEALGAPKGITEVPITILAHAQQQNCKSTWDQKPCKWLMKNELFLFKLNQADPTTTHNPKPNIHLWNLFRKSFSVSENLGFLTEILCPFSISKTHFPESLLAKAHAFGSACTLALLGNARKWLGLGTVLNRCPLIQPLN